VGAYATFDLYLAYDFPNGIIGKDGLLGDDELYFSMQNALNSSPPFYDAAGWPNCDGRTAGWIFKIEMT
jgi:hypothetical protein